MGDGESMCYRIEDDRLAGQYRAGVGWLAASRVKREPPGIGAQTLRED